MSILIDINLKIIGNSNIFYKIGIKILDKNLCEKKKHSSHHICLDLSIEEVKAYTNII